VTADCLRCRLPSTDGMAAFTIRTKGPPVEIRVAICTFYRCVGKYFRNVARITGNRFVHSTKGESSLCRMAEFRLRAQGSPTGLRVTVLTSDGDRSMRIANGLCRHRCGHAGQYGQQHPRCSPNAPLQISHCSTFRPHHLSDSGELRWYLFGLICARAARSKKKW
jgi:hypothetical protein